LSLGAAETDFDLLRLIVLRLAMKIIIILACCAALFSTGYFAVAGKNQTKTPAVPPDAAEVRHEIERVKLISKSLRDQSAALFLLAHDYAHLRVVDQALAFLKQCISLDAGFDPEGDPEFAPLKGNPDFQKLLERVHRRYSPVHRARVAFTISQKDLIPEGLAFDSKSGALYMSSLDLRKIVQIGKNGVVADFTRHGQYDVGPVCGLKVETGDESLWANVCSDSGKGAELLHLDRTGRLVERFAPSSPGPHLFNDLVLQGNDEIYLTDSLANRIYRLDRRLRRFFEVPLARGVYYANGIAISDDGNRLYVADAFGLLAVDLQSKETYEVDPGPSATLSGADGLYWYQKTLIAVQNSLGSPRIAQFRLSPDGRRVTKVAILEYKSPLVQLPTTGAIAGSQFYFISNSQLDNFREGKVLDPAKLSPIRISVVELEGMPTSHSDSLQGSSSKELRP
jgi:hypothetical protein